MLRAKLHLMLASVLLLGLSGVAHAQSGGALPGPRPAATASPASGNSTAVVTKAAVPKAVVPAKPPVKTAAQIQAERYQLIAWLAIAFGTLLAAFVALYPIVFYIRVVWPSRRQTIFDTLNTSAKASYMALYHSGDAAAAGAGAVGMSPARIDEAFSELYSKWFGRGPLIVPTLIISLLILSYCFLCAIAAGEALVRPSLANVATIPLMAVAAMTGAYILVTMDTIARVTQRDLLPDDLYLSALRLAACVPLGYAFASFAKADLAPFLALAISALPLQQIAAILRQTVVTKAGGTAAAVVSTTDALTLLSGVDQSVCDRLSVIGVNTITQLAYSDPVRLTMRTSLNFVFVLDIVSQSLAWVYLEKKLDTLRPMGLRGSYELSALRDEANGTDPVRSANAKLVITQIPTLIGLTTEQFENVLHQIADDPYGQFLVEAYS